MSYPWSAQVIYIKANHTQKLYVFVFGLGKNYVYFSYLKIYNKILYKYWPNT